MQFGITTPEIHTGDIWTRSFTPQGTEEFDRRPGLDQQFQILGVVETKRLVARHADDGASNAWLVKRDGRGLGGARHLTGGSSNFSDRGKIEPLGDSVCDSGNE